MKKDCPICSEEVEVSAGRPYTFGADADGNRGTTTNDVEIEFSCEHEENDIDQAIIDE